MMPNKKTIRITCSGSEMMPLSFLENLQGELKTLKPENAKRLKKAILELGFSEPITVWKHGEKYYILNGHQRVEVLSQMEKEGYTIPKVPVNTVDLDDEKTAKKLVLSLTSQYGTMTDKSVKLFLDEAGITIKEAEETFRFPEVDLKLKAEEPEKRKVEFTANTKRKTQTCPKCQHEFDTQT